MIDKSSYLRTWPYLPKGPLLIHQPILIRRLIAHFRYMYYCPVFWTHLKGDYLVCFCVIQSSNPEKSCDLIKFVSLVHGTCQLDHGTSPHMCTPEAWWLHSHKDEAFHLEGKERGIRPSCNPATQRYSKPNDKPHHHPQFLTLLIQRKWLMFSFPQKYHHISALGERFFFKKTKQKEKKKRNRLLAKVIQDLSSISCPQ